MREGQTARAVTAKVLRGLEPPRHAEEGDKEARGRVLVVGGASEMPGAVILAAEAALRAGAGKLRVATVRGVAAWVAAAVPESRVYSLPETRGGAVAPSAAARLAELAAGVDAVLVGPGMIDQEAIDAVVTGLLPRLERPTILDAGALSSLRAFDGLQADPRRPLVITPNADEYEELAGAPLGDTRAARLGAARELARRYGAVTVLKGAESLAVAPGGEAYRNRTGNVGLATSGSGDVLAGILAGLLARGAEPLTAAVWANYAHGRAADRLARRFGKIGYLARELLAEVPRALQTPR